MFNFSSKTLVNKEYKLSDFLAQIKATKEVKDDAKKIKKIIFQNVINASSLNVEEDEVYKNIYIIRIILKVGVIPKLFIEELDKNIEFHTYFICEFDNEVSTLISFKEIGKKVKTDRYYSHDFTKETNIDLPNINSVEDAYKIFLAYEVGLFFRKNETPKEYITRKKAINRLEFQIGKTESAIVYETQPKKKFEYNERLRKYRKEFEELIREDI